MSSSPEAYYTEERWQNWLDRMREEDIDPDEEDSARLLLNLQDDAAIAVAKVLTDYEEGELDEDTSLSKIGKIRDIVLSDVDVDDEEKVMLINGVQTSLVCVFYAAEEYVAGEPPADGTVEEYVRAAADAEAEENPDTALSYCTQAGTLVIEGAELDMSLVENLEYGLVAEWVNGLDSLQEALSDPEVVEEEGEADPEG